MKLLLFDSLSKDAPISQKGNLGHGLVMVKALFGQGWGMVGA